MSNKASENALVISSGTTTPEEVIKKIIGVELPSDKRTSESPDLERFQWSFETKYYSAEVGLYPLKDKTELKAGFCDSVQAIVCYFDAQKESNFDDILSWVPIIKDIKAEVQLMVCDNSWEDSSYLVTRKKYLNWCIKNEFEYVELSPSPDSDDDEETANCARGYDRVREALQAHPWANLIVKSDKEKDENEGAKADSCKHVFLDGEDVPLEEKLLDDVLSGDDPSGESLEALFGKFASMKEKATGLSGDARKKYAEEVAVAFWKAMGGDDEEIENLDD